jgi:DNA modification methylase
MGNTSPAARIFIGDSRAMPEIEDASIELTVTSPPYWHIKDYGVQGQMGFGQSLHEYLRDLFRVWQEVFRVLTGGARLCVNIGDQFARATTYGKYRVIPLHAEIIGQCEIIGFDFMGSVIWQKKTTMNTTGGATVMGSFPYPPNGIVEIDYEYIHIFKKPGKSRRVAKEVKAASRLSKAEWKKYFRGHWNFGGARKLGHEAMFPEELPRRLVKMFSFVGDTVLDPFVGSGTTAKVALELGRNAAGYEINKNFLKLIRAKLGLEGTGASPLGRVEVMPRSVKVSVADVDYEPVIQDAAPGTAAAGAGPGGGRLYRVEEVTGPLTIKVEGGLNARILGVKVADAEGTLAYLRRYVSGKQVFLRLDGGPSPDADCVYAYVYLKNRIFVNTYLIKSGLCIPDPVVEHRLSSDFRAIGEKRPC